MTYIQGGLIQASDFNNFVGNGVSGPNINATWNSTYGQQPAISTVAANTTILAATQWSSLNSTITSMATHQGTSTVINTGRVAPTYGTTISVLANVATDIGNCYTNRYYATSVGSQATNWTGTASKGTATGSGAAAWTINFTSTVTFANATAANSFFGAGGYVQIQFSKTSTGTVADTEWNRFIGSGGGGVVANAIILTSDASSKIIAGSTWTGTNKIGGSGSAAPASSLGFNQLNSGAQTIYKQFDTGGSAYSSNYLQCNASVSGSVLTIVTTWYDAGDGNTGSTAQISGGTQLAAGSINLASASAPTTLVTAYYPEQVNIANTWGAINIATSVPQ